MTSKQMTKKRYRIGLPVMIMAVLWLCSTGAVFAESSFSCMPSEQEIQKYKADGTWQQRVAYVKSLDQGSLTQELMERAIARERGSSTYSARATLPTRWKGMQTTGDAKILAVCVSFADTTSEDKLYTEAQLKSMIDGSGDEAQLFPGANLKPYESLQAYYERSSYGALNITAGEKAYSCTLSEAKDYYAKQENGDQVLLKEVLNKLDNEGINYSDYDMAPADGYIDGICINFAGENSDWGSMWWSHASRYPAPEDKWDAVSAGNYMFLETYDTRSSQGHQTLIHETGHMLGLPDYYHAYDSNLGIKTSDMMNDNSGDHNGFSKWLLGWIQEGQIVRITKDSAGETGATVGLTALSTEDEQLSSDDKLMAVIAPTDTSIYSEYFVVEYDENGVGNHDGETGHRIFHVDAVLNETQYDYAYDNLYSSDHNLIRAVSHAVDEYSYDPYFREGDQLLPDSDESSSFYGGSIMGFTGISLTDFKARTDGSKASFHVGFQEKEAVDGTLEFQKEQEKIGNMGQLTLISNKPLHDVDGEPEQAYYLDAAGNQYPVDVEVAYGSDHQVNVIYPYYLQMPLKPDTEYTLVIPAGRFQIDTDVFSEKCRIPVKTDTFPATQEQHVYPHDPGVYSSNLFSVGPDGAGMIRLREDLGNKVWEATLHTYRDTEETTAKSVNLTLPEIEGMQDNELYLTEVEAFQCYDGTIALAVVGYLDDDPVTSIYQMAEDGSVLAGPYVIEGSVTLVPIGNGLKGIKWGNDKVTIDTIDFSDTTQTGTVKRQIDFFAEEVKICPIDENTYALMNPTMGEVGLYDEDDKLIDTISTDAVNARYLHAATKHGDGIAVIHTKRNDPESDNTDRYTVYVSSFDAKGNPTGTRKLATFPDMQSFSEWEVKPASWGYLITATDEYGLTLQYFTDETFQTISSMETGGSAGAPMGDRFIFSGSVVQGMILSVTEPIGQDADAPGGITDGTVGTDSTTGRERQPGMGDENAPVIFCVLLCLTALLVGGVTARRKS